MNRALQCSAILLAILLAPVEAEASDTREIRRTLELDRTGGVSVETFKGSIEVTTWNEPRVEVLARIEPDPEGEHQERKVRETEVRVSGDRQVVRIESDYDGVRNRSFLGFGGPGTVPFVHYQIRIPATAKLRIRDHKSRTRVAGLKASLDLGTYKGRVQISDHDGSVRLETYKGEVRVEYARLAASDFETYKGTIELTLPRSSAFDLDADTGRRGTLDSDFETGTVAAGRRMKGHRAAVNGGGPRLSLETYKGSYRIHAR